MSNARPAETQLLQLMLLSEAAIETAMNSQVRPFHFRDPSHARVFAGFVALKRRGVRGIDVVTLLEEFACAGTLDEVGGIPGVIEILSANSPVRQRSVAR